MIRNTFRNVIDRAVYYRPVAFFAYQLTYQHRRRLRTAVLRVVCRGMVVMRQLIASENAPFTYMAAGKRSRNANEFF